ncbi:MAG: acyl-CoA thioesterase [Francisellaceae bacterium]
MNKYIKTYTVMSGHIDVTEHMSNVEYYEFFKSAIFAFLYENNFSSLNEDDDLWPIVLEESCKFYKEVLFNSEIKVSISFKYIGENKNKWLCIGEMHNTDGVVCAVWESLHGILNRKTRRIQPMTDGMFNLISLYTEKCHTQASNTN